jgi:hypothetical protein
MQQDLITTQVAPIENEMNWALGVRFNSDNISLEGRYHDEISAYRARRNWMEAFENNFLLDMGHDYTLSTTSSIEEGRFILKCNFLSACGRYAFWRLINHQAPDVQYLIETAHLPNSESAHADFIAAPDLTSVHEEAMIINPRKRPVVRNKDQGIFGWIKKALGCLNSR